SAPASPAIRRPTSAMSRQMHAGRSARANTVWMLPASAPVGATIRTHSAACAICTILSLLQHVPGGTTECRHAGEDAVEVGQRVADPEALRVDPEFTDGVLMLAHAFLDY